MPMNSIKYAFVTVLLAHLFFCSFSVGSQEFLTPSRYFDQVSKKFGQIRDYAAVITVDQNEGELIMKGDLIYKNPNKLRIDFKEPREQVLAMDGRLLTIYIPKYSYILEQRLKRRSGATIALMASSQELTYLKDNYSIAYVVGPEPVPLDDESKERVIKLKLQSHSSVTGFYQLEIAFTAAGMIRQVKGSTTNKTIVMNFTEVRLNQDIPDARFEYEAPVHANVYKGFLFEGIE
jgi:outer membrane lipoprotein-sorting protein